MKVLPLEQYEKLIEIKNKEDKQSFLELKKIIIKRSKVKSKSEHKVLDHLLNNQTLKWEKDGGFIFETKKFPSKIVSKLIKLLSKKKYKGVNKLLGRQEAVSIINDLEEKTV